MRCLLVFFVALLVVSGCSSGPGEQPGTDNAGSVLLKDKLDGKSSHASVYIKNSMEVRNIRVVPALRNTAEIAGEVKNRGDKTLTHVEITVFLLDKNEKAIHETVHHPVVSLGSHAFLLKPNYSRPFSCKIDRIPSDWSGKVRVDVTDILFQQ